jgi:hypothetical protein
LIEEMILKRLHASKSLPAKRVSPAYWLWLAVLLHFTDYFTGPVINLPTLFIVPVALAAWYNGRNWGLALAISMPLVRLSFHSVWQVQWTLVEHGINCGLLILTFSGFAILIDTIAAQGRTIQCLEGILPICCFCKKIRSEDQAWHQIEQYITERSEATFSHGWCPACAEKHYGIPQAA